METLGPPPHRPPSVDGHVHPYLGSQLCDGCHHKPQTLDPLREF